MRAPLRVFFALAIASASFAAVAAAVVALTPPRPPAQVALVRATSVSEVPLRIERDELRDLGAIARQKRGGTSAGVPRSSTSAVFLVRDDRGEVRAFVARDPRNGCALEWMEWHGWRFHDVCHGSMYDRNGRVIGGPSPWTLDEAIVQIRDGVVYVDTRDVLPGVWIAGR